MSSGSSKKLVLNSFRILKDVLPEVLIDLAAESPEERCEWQAAFSQGDPELYPTIRDGEHQIIVTPGIQKEYLDEAENMGLPQELFLRVIQHLQTQNMIIRPRVRDGRRNFERVPNYHRSFLEDAIRADVGYFVTERNVWLDRTGVINNNYGIRIITPGEFINREGFL